MWVFRDNETKKLNEIQHGLKSQQVGGKASGIEFSF